VGRGGEGPAVLDLRPWIEGVHRSVERHNLGEPGAYCRWLRQDEKSARNLGLDPYGCADAANILYTLGCFPRDGGERLAWVAALQGLQDPATGLLRRGRVPDLGERGELAFPHLAGTFHYLFNVEHARRPWPHSARLIDTCLAIESRRLFPFCSFVGFAEIDWVYCLSRSSRHTPHRFDQGRAALRRLAHRYVAFLDGLDLEGDDGPNDLHALFGALCAVAELQQALPGLIRTERPLRLVLDRRPFI
jgi:hypothetical protein